MRLSTVTGQEEADSGGKRRRRRYRHTVRFALLLASALAGIVGAIEWSRRAVFQPGPPSATDKCALLFPRELRDAVGDTLVIDCVPQRIASQTLATDEILLAICPHERIVALSNLALDTTYSNVAAEARRLGKPATQGAEQILLLEPDLIFVASYSRAETVQLLKASHAPVFRFANFNSIAAIQENIRTVGYAIGASDQAEVVIRRMDSSLAAVRARVPANGRRPRVMSYSPGGYTAGLHTTFDDMVQACGAINVTAENGIDGFARISAEKIVDWEPDYLVSGVNQGEIESTRQTLLSDPIVAASPAGKGGRILLIDNQHFLTVSQYLVRGVEDLADGLYGKRP